MKKFKRITSLMLILAVVLCLAAFLFSCADKNEAVKIEPVEGTFKTVYMLDEELNLSGSKISVTYSNGETETVSVNRSMVSGFDSYTLGSQKTMTIKYKGASTKVFYDVISETDVDTPFRLSQTAAIDGNTVSVTVSSQNVETLENGVYAIYFRVNVVGMTISSVSSYMGASFGIQHKTENGVTSIILYSKDGAANVTSSGTIAKLSFKKSTNYADYRVTLTHIRISDGVKDFVMIPNSTIDV